MFVEERHQEILRLLNENEKVKVKELSKRFEVTEDCIRKDLASMEAKNLLKRTYGGAVLPDTLHPGHTNIVSIRKDKNIKEKNINLQISKNLEKRLTKLGAIVYLTRYDDYDLSVNNTINRKRSDLSRRGNIINKSDCDLFLSIHLNAENTGIWKGAQTFYNTNNKENKKIAELLQQQFKEDLNSKRKAKNKNDL